MAAVLLAGCSFVARTFDLAFPADAGLNLAELPIVLRDETGQVVSVAVAPPIANVVGDVGMATIQGNVNAVILHWLGGSCDERVSITASGSGQITFTLSTAERAGACDAVGHPRGVMVQLAHPVDMSRTSFTIEP